MSSELDSNVEDQVKALLRALVASFEKTQLSGRKLLSDEEIVYKSLKNPRLGDVKVIVFAGPPVQVFIANRRDANSPFAVMSNHERRNYIERRPLNDRIDDVEFCGLFLISLADREMIQDVNQKRVEFYSTLLHLFGEPVAAKTAPSIESKPYSELTPSEKIKLLTSLSEMDSRKDKIMKEMCEFIVSYARYKQAEKLQTIRIPPFKAKEYVGQFSRDMYPQNLRMVLMRDFPAEHNRNCAYVQEKLAILSALAKEKMSSESNEYNHYLNDITLAVNEQIAQIRQLAGRK